MISIFKHVSIGALLLCSATIASAQDKPASIVVVKVVQREVNTGHRVVGSVTPVRTSIVGSAVDGRVVEFLVEEGDAVKENQPLARLRTGTLEIELAAANAELDVYEQELKEKQNGSRPEEVAAAKARMAAADAVKSNAAAKLTRTELLFEKDAANDADLNDARERAESASQLFLAAEAQWKLVTAGPRQEQIARAQAQVALQRANVDLLKDRIEKFTVRAPFDGYVTKEDTEVGEWIKQGDPIAEVVALSKVDVRANVPAEQAVRLQRGRPIRIEFPEQPGEIFTGVVDRIVPQADFRSRTFPVNIQLDNRYSDGRPLLMAGMLARAVLPTGAKSRLPLVPKDALVLQGAERFVCVIDVARGSTNTGKVRLAPVTLGVTDGGLVQVNGTIRAGELVAVLGNERLKDGQDVEFTLSRPKSPKGAQ
ncbi:MAG: efflux RND transporter periplasmic adaptor subunit [Pirellulaceae bacterium]|nr:efflux RND transporter periplasmic adaptor subunit [Pirellulaceae bacterium]